MREEISKPIDVKVKPAGVYANKAGKPDASPHQLLLLIQQSFDRGNKQDFFRAFDQLVPNEMRLKDFAYKKLEFYLQIYFVVFIKHPNINA